MNIDDGGIVNVSLKVKIKSCDLNFVPMRPITFKLTCHTEKK